MPEATAAGPSMLSVLPVFAGMFLIFYILVFRPQNQERKDREGMIKNLKKHDEVVTIGGVFGTVVNVRPESITLRIDENVRIEVEPSAITRLVKAKAGVSAAAVPAGAK